MHKPSPTLRPVRRRQTGAIAGTVLMLLALALVATFVVGGIATTQMRLSVRGQNHAAALALAESGVDDAIERMQTVSVNYAGTATDSAYSATSGWAPLYEDYPTNTASAGKFRTTISLVAGQTRKWLVTSVGQAADGTQATIKAVLQNNVVRIGSAAIEANGPINVGGTADVETVPTGMHDAHVFANGDISMGGSSYVDGRLESYGNVTGTAYYPSVSGAPKILFPDWTTTESWRTAWLAAATGAGSTTYNPNAINFKNGAVTITAPAYLSGTLSLNSSQAIIFSGSADDVVYIDGDVKMTGTCMITNGVTLVVRGTFDQGGNTTYKIVPPATTSDPCPSLVVFGETTAGVASSSGTITTNLAGTTGTDSAGIVWSISGSTKVNGGSNFTGALVISQPGAGVVVNGNYNHYYPDGLHMDKEMPTVITTYGIVEP